MVCLEYGSSNVPQNENFQSHNSFDCYSENIKTINIVN